MAISKRQGLQMNKEEILQNYFLKTKIDYYEGTIEHLAQIISRTNNQYITPDDLEEFLTRDSFLSNYTIMLSINRGTKNIVIRL